MKRRLWLPVLLVLLSLVERVHAHDPYETTTQILLYRDRVEVTMIMARATAAALREASHIEKTSTPWPDEKTMGSLYELSSAGQPLVLKSKNVELGKEGEAKDDLVFSFQYAGVAKGSLHIRARYLENLEQGYTGIVQVLDGDSAGLIELKVLHSSDSTLSVAGRATFDRDAGKSLRAPERTSRIERLGLFFKLGLKHVLLGYDHLLFLLGVLIACRRLGQLVALLTTFTVAHGATLALAVLRYVPLMNDLVEPLIAMSIAVAAFWGKDLEVRGLLVPMTFAFGLVHGLGFASGLEALVDTGEVRTLGLIGFNLGVEAGQIAAACALLPLIAWCRRTSSGQVALNWGSRVVGAVGIAIFAWRIHGV